MPIDREKWQKRHAIMLGHDMSSLHRREVYGQRWVPLDKFEIPAVLPKRKNELKFLTEQDLQAMLEETQQRIDEMSLRVPRASMQLILEVMLKSLIKRRTELEARIPKIRSRDERYTMTEPGLYLFSTLF